MKKSPLLAGLQQFGAQVLGLVLAIGISILLAARLGAGLESDAFLFARRLATGLTEILGQVLAFFFVPLLVSRLRQAPDRFSGAFFQFGSRVFAAGIVFFVAIFAASGPIANLLLPDMAAETQARATLYLRIFAASLPAVLIALYFSATLNMVGSFGGPVLLRQLPRVAIFFVLIFAAGSVAMSASIAFTLTWLVVASLIGIWALRIVGRQALSGGLSAQEETQGSGAGTFGTAVLIVGLGGQATLWMETFYAASVGTGQLTILEFAQRLGGLLGSTLSSALILPLFSLWILRPETRSFGSISRYALTAFALLVLIQGFLVINAAELFELLYGYGAFTDAARGDLLATIQVLAIAPFSILVMRMAFVWHMTSARRFRLLEAGVVVFLDLLVRWICIALFIDTLGLRAIALGMIVAPLVMTICLTLFAVSWSDLRDAGIGAQKRLPLVAAFTALALFFGHEVAVLATGPHDGVIALLLICGLSGLAGLVVMLGSWKALRVPLRPKD
ncbi:MAG: lipid II flippase MurJ [Pseudomonadota bacterium]